MENDPVSSAHETDHRPQIVLEGGSEALSVLLPVVSYRIEEMAPGQILQIVSHLAEAAGEIAAWCRETGHELLEVLTSRDEVLVWIRKGEAAGGCSAWEPCRNDSTV